MVLAIMSTIVILFIVLYEVINYMKARLIATRSDPQPPVTQPPTQTPPPKRIIPPPTDPILQMESREEHYQLLQRCLNAKFRDIDTYFGTRSLLDKAQTRAEQKRKDEYLEFTEKMEKLRNPTPILFSIEQPLVDVPQVPPIVENLPWLPDNNIPPWVSPEPRPPAYPEWRPEPPRYGASQRVPQRAMPNMPGSEVSYHPEYHARTVDRVADWLNGTERPPSPVGSEGSRRSSLLSDSDFGDNPGRNSGGFPGGYPQSRHGSTIDVNSRLSHISI
jgi:hypothetical protein